MIRRVTVHSTFESSRRALLQSLQGLEAQVQMALASIWWGLTNNAEDFDLVPGFKTLRQAQTLALNGVPALWVVFRIQGEEVNLKFVQVVVEGQGFRAPVQL